MFHSKVTFKIEFAMTIPLSLSVQQDLHGTRHNTML